MQYFLKRKAKIRQLKIIFVIKNRTIGQTKDQYNKHRLYSRKLEKKYIKNNNSIHSAHFSIKILPINV